MLESKQRFRHRKTLRYLRATVYGKGAPGFCSCNTGSYLGYVIGPDPTVSPPRPGWLFINSRETSIREAARLIDQWKRDGQRGSWPKKQNVAKRLRADAALDALVAEETFGSGDEDDA